MRSRLTSARRWIRVRSPCSRRSPGNARDPRQASPRGGLSTCVTLLTEPDRKLLNCCPVRPEWHRFAAQRTHRRIVMKGKIICTAAALFLSLAVSSAPANAQFGFGGGGGGEDMMTQMAPMLEMMKAKMGK